MVKRKMEATSWEVNLRVPYEQISASKNEKEKTKILRNCITRTTSLINKNLRDFDEFEDLDNVLCFMEQLLNMLNRSHILLQSEMTDFDKRTLPIMEKYASLLVYQSSHSCSQEECMKKLVKFLSSLPVHQNSKTLPQSRVKKIVTLLLNATQSSSAPHLEESTKKSKKNRNAYQVEKENITSVAVLNQPETSPVNSTKLIPVQCEEQPTVQNHDTNFNTSEEPNHNHEASKMLVDVSLEPIEKTIAEAQARVLKNVNQEETKDVIQDESANRDARSPNKVSDNDQLLNHASSQTGSDTEKGIPRMKCPTRHTDLQELQKMLRDKFPVPWNVTTTEKFLLRKLLRLLKSKKSLKTPVWKVSKLKRVASGLKLKPISHLDSPSNSNESCSFKSCGESKPECNTPSSSVFFQSEPKSANSGEESFFSCNTSRSESLDTHQSPIQKEDSFDKLKNLEVNKTAESELTLSDIELMEEMEVTLRRLEKESEGELSDRSAELLNNPLLCTGDAIEKLPNCKSNDEHKKPEGTTKSLNATDESSAATSSTERRRSPRLAGLPALPLIFTQQPLPGKRKISSPLSDNTSLRRISNSEENGKTSQNKNEDRLSKPPCKRAKYNDPEKPDIHLTPNLPKKPVRRRIVSVSSDPYLFIASDEELVVEEPTAQITNDISGHSKQLNATKSGSSTLPSSSHVVELSPFSDVGMETVLQRRTVKEQTKNRSKNQPLEVLPITPDSETGSCRASSSLSFNIAQDEKSDNSIVKFATSGNSSVNQIQFDHANPYKMFNKITWQEIRKLMPTCWAGILEQHVKAHHPDELLLCKEPEESTSNIPTVYCCSVPDSY